MIYINITNFVLISELEKYHSMTEMRHLKSCYFYPNNFKFCVVKTKLEISTTILHGNMEN